MKELIEAIKTAVGPVVEEIARDDGSRVIISRKDYEIKELTKPPRPAAELGSLEAVPQWILTCWRWMPPEIAESWLFFGDAGICLVPDTRAYPCLGRSAYKFAPTMAAKLWAMDEAVIGQKDFKRLIEAAVAMGEEQIILRDAAKWLTAVVKMKQVARVTKESCIESSTDFKVAFESQAGPETATVPKELVVELLPFEGSTDKVRLGYQVEPIWADGEPPRFSLTCHAHDVVMAQARKAAVAWIQATVAELAAAEGHQRRLVVFHGSLSQF